VRWSLTALGRNALFVYVTQHVVLTSLTATHVGRHTLADALYDHVGSSLGVALLAVAAGAVAAAAMHACDWYVTV
jgi:uncharacterized membrane protein YeiB